MMKLLFLYLLLTASLAVGGIDFRWESFLLSDSKISESTIYSMALDSSGNRWFGTNKGLFVFTQAESWGNFTVENTQYQLLSDTINCIEVDAFGVLWIGSEGGLNRYSFGVWEKFTEENTFGKLPDNRILSLVIYDRKVKWIGTGKGFARLDGILWDSYPESKIIGQIGYTKIKAIAVDSNEKVWVGTQLGLFEFNGFNFKAWTLENTNNALPHPFVTALKFDRLGRLWIGTQNGVGLYANQKWVKFKEEHYLKHYVNVIETNLEKGVWIGTRRGLIHFLKPQKHFFWNASNTKYGILGFRVLSVLEENNRELWISTRKGLSRRIPIFE